METIRLIKNIVLTIAILVIGYLFIKFYEFLLDSFLDLYYNTLGLKDWMFIPLAVLIIGLIQMLIKWWRESIEEIN